MVPGRRWRRRRGRRLLLFAALAAALTGYRNRRLADAERRLGNRTGPV